MDMEQFSLLLCDVYQMDYTVCPYDLRWRGESETEDRGQGSGLYRGGRLLRTENEALFRFSEQSIIQTF